MSNAKTDCEVLLNAVLPIVQELLAKYGEFYPVGAQLTIDGEVRHCASSTGDEHPPSQELVELLQQAFQAGAKSGDCKATIIVYDILTVPPGKQNKQDAIAAAMDHQDNYSVVVIYPYSFNSGGQVEIEAPFAISGESNVFGR